MSWRYRQSDGHLTHVFPEGNEELVGVGYAGHGEGLNNPAMQDIHEVGPIPQGHWIIGAPYDSPRLGPFVLPLMPEPETNTFGRSGFKLHGDRATGIRWTASRGCIVISRQTREAIHESADTDLEVIP